MSFVRTCSTRLVAIVIATFLFAGTVFAAGPADKLLYSFQGSSSPNGQDGQGPGDLIADEAGNLYGVTAWGGICNIPHHLSYQCGTVFELSPPVTSGGAWTETILYEFGTNPADGQSPLGNLIRDRQGNLYGVTAYSGGGYDGNFGCGNFFELSPPAQQGGTWTETILYNFQGGYTDGCNPLGTLVADSHNDIFGATVYGGGVSKTSTGGIFEISPPSSRGGAWTEAFTSDLGLGLYPTGGLAISKQGVLYGSSGLGGALAQATVFQLIPPSSRGGAWTPITLYTFQGGSDGSNPGGLIVDGQGNLYGVTSDGGTAGYGTSFQLTPPQNGGTWIKTILYSFQGGNDGIQPIAKMVFDNAGNLYGTTFEGGGAAACSAFQGCGTAFKLTPEAGGWSEGILHRFQGAPVDGAYVNSSLLFVGHTLYGATGAGGTVSPYNFGVVFQIK